MSETEEPQMKRRKQSENYADRLSDLPDPLLTLLISFLGTRDAVRTCVLSRRYKNLWKLVPSLRLNSYSSIFRLKPPSAFNKFVSKILSCRDHSVPVDELDLGIYYRDHPRLLIKILKYVLAHNVQHAKVTLNCEFNIPPILFSCHTLKSLDLSVWYGYGDQKFPISTNFPALTRLRLCNLAFLESESNICDPFSSFLQLKVLVLDRCVIRYSQVLRISNPSLVDLTINYYNDEVYKIMLLTPNLSSFTFNGFPALEIIPLADLSFIKEVKIEAKARPGRRPYLQRVPSLSCKNVLNWLQVLAGMRSLTISSVTLEVLSLSPDLKRNPPFLPNLRSLTLKVEGPGGLQPSSQIVVDSLIKNSPHAKITFAVQHQ